MTRSLTIEVCEDREEDGAFVDQRIGVAGGMKRFNITFVKSKKLYAVNCQFNTEIQNLLISSPLNRISATAMSARVVHVSREVFGEVVGAREALAAGLAVVGPLARVDAQVARQVALAAERAPTE